MHCIGGWVGPRTGLCECGKRLCMHCTGAGLVPGPVCVSAGNSPPIGIRSPDHLTRSESLYRLSYPSPSTNTDASLHIEFVTLCSASRWLVAGLSTRMTAFYPGPVHMGIVVDNVGMVHAYGILRF